MMWWGRLMSHMTLLARFVGAAMMHRRCLIVRSGWGRSLVRWSPVISGGVAWSGWQAGTLYPIARHKSWGLADRVRV